MRYLILAACVGLAQLAHTSDADAQQMGTLELTVIDVQSRQPIPSRVHIRNRRGMPIIPRDTIAWRTHFIIDGKAEIELPPGIYAVEIEHGPEFEMYVGKVSIAPNKKASIEAELERFVDMKAEGWWSGELHVHRPRIGVESLDVIPLLMRAEDLHVAPIISWWNNRNYWDRERAPASLLTQFDDNRFYHVMGGEDEREGGALLYFNLPMPLDIRTTDREYPSPVSFLEQGRSHPGIHVDIEKPFWWDVPVWIATGKCDSIGIANNHMYRDGVLPNEAWGKPRDTAKYPGPQGNGRWTQEIYYQLLNSGVRIPPSAGSASGVLPNPVGYNRAYVYCGQKLTYQKWFERLRAGQVVVTNGPLLRPRVNDQLPGHLFKDGGTGKVELNVQLEISQREENSTLEIIKNGEVAYEMKIRNYGNDGGQLPKIRFEESGWMLVRVISDKPNTFRFASTGPYYVEIGGKPRISRQSCQFFLDWVNERIGRVKSQDAKKRDEVLLHHARARQFWQRRVDAANAE